MKSLQVQFVVTFRVMQTEDAMDIVVRSAQPNRDKAIAQATQRAVNALSGHHGVMLLLVEDVSRKESSEKT